MTHTPTNAKLHSKPTLITRMAAVIALAVVGVSGGMQTSANADVYFDTNGYEDADLGPVDDDDLSDHITGTIGGEVVFLAQRGGQPWTNVDYVSSPTNQGNRAVELQLGYNGTSTGYNMVRNNMNSSVSGDEPVYYSASWYIAHNGLTTTVQHAVGMHLRIVDNGGRIPFGLQPLDNGNIVYVLDQSSSGATSGGVVLASQAYNQWYDVTMAVTPDVDPLTPGIQRLANVWVNGVQVLTDLAWTDGHANAQEGLNGMFLRWQTQDAVNYAESPAHPHFSYLDDVTITSTNPVPEPGALSLFGLGIAMMCSRRTRRA